MKKLKLFLLVMTVLTTPFTALSDYIPPSNSNSASTLVQRDGNGNFSSNTITLNSLISGYTTTATAAGTTTLASGSSQYQYFTGVLTQTVLLPVVSTLTLGQSFYIFNNSSGNVTVQSSGTNTIQTMAANTWLFVQVISTSGTGTSSWNAEYSFQTPGIGTVTSVALSDGSTTPIYTISGSPVTTTGTLTFTLNNQTGNEVFASPNGSSGQPGFRALVNSDFPTSGVTATSYTSANITVNAQGIVTAASNGSGGGGLSPTTITGNTTLVAGNWYRVNDSSQAILTLPSSCSLFDEIQITGIGSGGWEIASNSSASSQQISEGSLQSVASSSNALPLANSASIFDSILMYCAQTTGPTLWNAINYVGTTLGQITGSSCSSCTTNTVGSTTTMTFHANDTFVISSGSGNVSYCLSAGGGGGGVSQGGGGAAGGYLSGSTIMTPGSYTVTIGGGGAGANGGSDTASGSNGSNSVFAATYVTLTAIGGGGGATQISGGTQTSAGNGGSGGGGSAATTNGGQAPGGTGTAGQGNSGGNGFRAGDSYGGGGGGSGTAGVNATSTSGGNGGNGTTCSLDSVAYTGGGGGGGSGGTQGAGQAGGGNGGNTTNAPGSNASTNTGSGGGGSNGTGNGGNGAVGDLTIQFKN